MTTSLEILRNDAVEWLATSIGTDEPEILLDVIYTFLGDATQLVARMQTALVQNDEQLLFRAAHTLKSSTAIIGADRMSESCETLETALRRHWTIDRTGIVEKIAADYAQVCDLLNVEIQKLEKVSV